MRKTILSIAMLCMGIGANAQEIMIDSIAAGTHPNIGAGGDMGQMLYAYYTSAKNTDSLTIDVFSPDLTSMGKVSVSSKNMGDVIASNTNGQIITVLFYNSAKKDATLVITDLNGRAATQKSIKGIASGDKAFLVNALNPERFLLVYGTKNGFKATAYDMNLEEQWNVDGDQELVDIKTNMDMLYLIGRKKSSNGAYLYTINNLQTEEGNIVSKKELKDGNDMFYPMFISVSEGMSYTGGFYFTGGKGLDKTPEGIYFASLSPEGEFDALTKTPYSQVIQDIKGNYASKLTSGDYKIMLHEAARKMDGSGFFVMGEIYSNKVTANGNALFTKYDMVSIAYDNENKYAKTIVTKNHKKEATIKGRITNSNDMDVAKWVSSNGFFDYKAYLSMGENDNIVYFQNDNHTIQICAKVIGDSSLNTGVCFVANKESAEGSTSNIVLNADAPTSANAHGFIRGMRPDVCTLYELNKSSMVLWTSPLPTDMRNPDHVQDDAPPQPDDAPPSEDAPEN